MPGADPAVRQCIVDVLSKLRFLLPRMVRPTL